MDTRVEQPNNSPAGYCVACGNPLRIDTGFCSNCGQPVQAGAPAAYWRRAAAWLIDLPISLIPVGLAYVLALQIPGATEPVYERSLEGTTTTARTLTELAFVILVPLYWALLQTAWNGQTLGKRLLSIAVVRQRAAGSRISAARSLGRSYIQIAFFVLLLPLVIDYLWPLSNTRRRSLHDLVAGTIVIDKPRSP